MNRIDPAFWASEDDAQELLEFVSDRESYTAPELRLGHIQEWLNRYLHRVVPRILRESGACGHVWRIKGAADDGRSATLVCAVCCLERELCEQVAF